MCPKELYTELKFYGILVTSFYITIDQILLDLWIVQSKIHALQLTFDSQLWSGANVSITSWSVFS